MCLDGTRSQRCSDVAGQSLLWDQRRNFRGYQSKLDPLPKQISLELGETAEHAVVTPAPTAKASSKNESRIPSKPCHVANVPTSTGRARRCAHLSVFRCLC